MWVNDRGDPPLAKDEREINERYIRGEGRIVIETNREKLPGFVGSMKEPGYLDLRPFYQRRPRWSHKKQSLLIESFIMNIPVPPVFLYEKEYNSYEVMDGQQRITAIRDFYENRFELEGLEMWPELNGRKYHNLPEKLKAGVDRRSITSIVLLKESTADEEAAWALRETVFERLNTGGVELEHQEIRNALYQGALNDLLFELARLDAFRNAWGIPRFVENEIEKNPEVLSNSIFSKMEDLEIILRFFALRHADHYRRGMQGFLDLYTQKASAFKEEDIGLLRQLFITSLNVAVEIYGDKVFRPFDPEAGDWEKRPHKAFHDAVMIGISNRLDKIAEFPKHRDAIIEGTRQLFRDHPKGTFTGRGNSKNDVQERIRLYGEMLGKVVG
ncbi:MAG: DUF262 domain-containing protein [Xanthobacteraceae bacterium]|nr:DUF262 domain-containing protein [Xanthobacteraceae bacterium]